MNVAIHARIEDYGSIEQVLVHYSSLGFKALEMDCPWRVFPNFDPRKMKDLLNQMNIVARFHIRPLDAASFVQQEIYKKESLYVQKAINTGSEIGVDQVSIHPPYFSSLETNRKVKEKAVDLLRDLAKVGAEKSEAERIKFSVESFCYKPFIFYSPQEFRKFLNEVPGLGVILETGHLFQMGFDLSEMVNLFDKRIYDVHVHDATKDSDFSKATHLPLGKGLIDFEKLLKNLRNVKYDGWLTLEIKPNANIDALIKSRKMLEKLISVLT